MLPSIIPSSFSSNRSKTRSSGVGCLFEYGSCFIYRMILRDMFKEFMGGRNNDFQRHYPYQIMGTAVYSIKWTLVACTIYQPCQITKTKSSMLQYVTIRFSYAGSSSLNPLSCRTYLLSMDTKAVFYWRQELEEQRRKFMDKRMTKC